MKQYWASFLREEDWTARTHQNPRLYTYKWWPWARSLTEREIAVGTLNDEKVVIWPGITASTLHRPPANDEKPTQPMQPGEDQDTSGYERCADDASSDGFDDDDLLSKDLLVVGMVFENQPTKYVVQIGSMQYGVGLGQSPMHAELVMEISASGKVDKQDNCHGSLWVVSLVERPQNRYSPTGVWDWWGPAKHQQRWEDIWPRSYTAAKLFDVIDPEKMGTQVLVPKEVTTEPFELCEVEVVAGLLRAKRF